MQQRRDELQAKRARLEELRRQRNLRQDQTQIRSSDDRSIISPTQGRASSSREELETLISTLVGDSTPASGTASRDGSGGSGLLAATRGSRPGSVLSAGELSFGESGRASPAALANPTSPPSTQLQASSSTQTLTTAPLSTVYEFVPAPAKEVLSYSKGVQTSEAWTGDQQTPPREQFDLDGDLGPATPRTPRNSKRLSRREREKDEELRESVRREIEEELRMIRELAPDGSLEGGAVQPNINVAALTTDELQAVTTSNEFLDFLDRSSKVVERALDEEYDVLADYTASGANKLDEEADEYGGKGRRGIREIAQFWDERWSKKRMISDLNFSPKFPELVLSSYTKNPSAPHDPDGLIQIWNLHLRTRPEHVFHAQSDILCAKFSPFHPSLIIGGAYSGQVLLWDTRSRHPTPVQKTPLTGSGHTHPIYSIDLVGTQNANNIISTSTDGVVCGWTVDMLAQPQEYIALSTPPPAKTEDLSPTCMAFPRADPTYFLVGTEEGTIYPCHRYDRAGAKAGVDARVAYRSHAAPVMSLDFHPTRGPIDLGNLMLSSSLDWSVKLWKVRAPSGTSTATTSASAAAGAPLPTTSSATNHRAVPLLDLNREDVVYSAQWSPTKPSIFSLVDGAGSLEIWDLNVDTEVPVAKTQPSSQPGRGIGMGHGRSLNKLAWESTEGRKIAVGGLDGVVTVFEVGGALGGDAGGGEWHGVRKMVSRLENPPATGVDRAGEGPGSTVGM